MAVSLFDRNILIVEDHAGVSTALRVILCSFHHVDIAGTAGAAMKFLIESPVNLAIIDVGLPDFSGMELLRRMRATGQDVKVIVMTGRGSFEAAEEALRLGAVAYLLKPFNLQEILTLVQSTL